MQKPFKDPRKQAYLNPEGADRPLVSPIPEEVLKRARRYRQDRLRAELDRHDVAAILLYDPVNIRYATDASAIQVWALHNATRSCMIVNGGPCIAFEYPGMQHVVSHLETIDEVHASTSWFYLVAGDRIRERVEAWADRMVALLRQHGGGNMRLAVDKLEPLGVEALARRGVTLVEGQELTEHARAIKSPDEIALMRWTIRVAEAGMARMYELSEPGRTEQEIWAELHHENARSGGEWIETRICVAGPRTKPWYQECSGYVCREGDMLAFDTDMIGPYGYCADLSRSWTIGHVPMTNAQKLIYGAAREQIEHNMALLKPGLSFREFNERSWKIPERFRANRYSLAIHGVGLVDEWPTVLLHPDFEHSHGGHFEENMTVCVESLIGDDEGTECVKLETQVLIGPNGAERLDSFPWEDA
jgi:Xaa-Pro aminopeptidase